MSVPYFVMQYLVSVYSFAIIRARFVTLCSSCYMAFIVMGLFLVFWVGMWSVILTLFLQKKASEGIQFNVHKKGWCKELINYIVK